MEMKRNITLFYVVRALFLPFFWLPILYFYLTQIKGFSIPQTTFLLSLQELLLIFLEVPTGVIADKISRKFSISLGYAITSIPFALFPFFSNFYIFILLFGIKAVGKALVSGADSAILYDSLVELNKTAEYKKITTRAGAWTMGIASTAMFLGGVMGERGLYNLTLWLPLPLQLIGAAAAIYMIEPEVSRRAQAIQSENYLTHIAGAAKSVIRSRQVLVPALVFAVIEGTAVNMKWYYPAIFESYGMSLFATGAVMTILYAGRTVVGVIGPRLIKEDAKDNVVMWLKWLALAWLVVALGINHTIVVLALMLVILGNELTISSAEEIVHDGLESKVRATGMSFVNMLSSVAATLLLWGWGLANSGLGLRGAVTIQIVVMLTILFIFYDLYNRLFSRINKSLH